MAYTVDGQDPGKASCLPAEVSEFLNKSSTKTIQGVTLVIMIAAVFLGCAYVLAPHSNYHAFVDNVITQIKDNQLSVGQALLYISLPIMGSSFLIGIAIHLYKKYQAFKTKFHDDKWASFSVELKPTRKQVAISAIALVLLAALAVGGYFVFKDIPLANQWMNNTVVPAFSQKIQLWQGLAYMGGGAIGAALLTGLIIHLVQKQKAKPTYFSLR